MPLFGGPPDVQKLKASRNVRGLVAALGYAQDQKIQAAAAAALAEIGQGGPVGELAGALAHKDQQVRLWAVDALGKTGQAWAAAPLIEALKDRDRFVRAGAATSLGKTHSPAAAAALIAALGDAEGEVRANAARALAQVGGPEALASLSGAAVHDSSSYVRSTAEAALVQLSALDRENERAAQQVAALLKEWQGAAAYHSGPETFAGLSRRIVEIGECTLAGGGPEALRLVARRARQLALHRGLPVEIAGQVAGLWAGIGGFEPGG